MIRVLIVAGYASVRAGLHVMLSDVPDCEIVGEVSGTAELERLLPSLRPDVVLHDIAGNDDLQRLRAILGEAEIGLVALGERREDVRLLADCSLPGWGFLLKEADGPEIAAAIRAAATGLIVLDRSLASFLMTPPNSYSGSHTVFAPVEEVLTPRELEVLQLMADGLPNKVIAARLKISLHTVKFHVASILAKLDASSRTEAVTIGARSGYLTL